MTDLITRIDEALAGLRDSVSVDPKNGELYSSENEIEALLRDCRAALTPPEPSVCEWRRSDKSEWFRTSCMAISWGEARQKSRCCFCGKPLREVSLREADAPKEGM